ncbi:hypothetical protein CSC16_0987 [Proteus mirabilis]|nr:hypothetical protein CSC16_0987 [Proteus mirabilis]
MVIALFVFLYKFKFNVAEVYKKSDSAFVFNISICGWYGATPSGIK